LGSCHRKLIRFAFTHTDVKHEHVIECKEKKNKNSYPLVGSKRVLLASIQFSFNKSGIQDFR